MCCTDKEMAAEGKKLPTDRWFTPVHVPCCVQDKEHTSTVEVKEERKASIMETGVPCGKCIDEGRTFMQLMRVVRKAEQHDGKELAVPVCELHCNKCGADASFTVAMVNMLSSQNGVEVHIPEKELT